VRIPPYHFLHVLDQNLNVTRVELGPKTFVRQDHEKVLLGPSKVWLRQATLLPRTPTHSYPPTHPHTNTHSHTYIHMYACMYDLGRRRQPQHPVPHTDAFVHLGRGRGGQMVVVPPKQYCIIENPVVLDEETHAPVLDQHQQYKLRHADQEVRLSQDPFPLYPGEVLLQAPTPLLVVKANSALRLRALRDYTDTGADGREVHHVAGDETLFPGPATYLPNVSVEVVETIKAVIIGPNEALRLRARLDCVAKSDGKARVAGEEWHVTKAGAYLPGVYEEVVRVETAHVLTDMTALHLKALRTFTDVYGKQRRNGEEWLVTARDSETHTPNVYEQVVGTVTLTTLTNRQFCVVKNPVNAEGVPQLGQQKLIKGEKSFFLQPGEVLRNGIQDVFVLGEEESLVLRATEDYEDTRQDGTVVARKPGDRWTVQGPCEYFPPVQIEVVARRYVRLLHQEGGGGGERGALVTERTHLVGGPAVCRVTARRSRSTRTRASMYATSRRAACARSWARHTCSRRMRSCGPRVGGRTHTHTHTHIHTCAWVVGCASLTVAAASGNRAAERGRGTAGGRCAGRPQRRQRRTLAHDAHPRQDASGHLSRAPQCGHPDL
jgi:hypothetical protein